VPEPGEHGGRPACDIELAVDVLEMLRDGARADVEGMRDGRVGAAERGEAQDMDLPVGQGVESARSGRAEALAGTVSLAGSLDGVDQRATQDA
jgi:hypothetical protein